jgi:hypothetical protein
MEQSATPKSNRRRNWLAIFSFILTLIPGVGWIGVASGTLPYSSETVLLVVWLGGVGLLLGIYSSFKVSSGRRIEKRVGDRLGQVSMIIGLVLLGNWLALPNFIAMRNAAKNANLKDIARTLQASTEVYKKTHNGERPVSVGDVEGLLSNKVTSKKIPLIPSRLTPFPAAASSMAYPPAWDRSAILPRGVIPSRM